MNEGKTCYSRLLIDNHITDLKDSYMRKFSPEEYVRMVRLSGVESAMVYACDHNGNCYYPTQAGHIHANLDGRDIFGETVAGLRKAGIVPVAYYTVNYHNDCARRLPHTRVIDNVGMDHDGRYHFTCPNQPDALAFYETQIAEILQYDVGGIFIDMTFWPTICCCSACRKKYGKPFPEVIDWDSPEWVGFQRFRERSLAEFARKLTDFVRRTKPGITVTHQFSPVLHGWYLGQSGGIAAASDYASGDFYGGKTQQRFAVKAFAAYTRIPPFEFMTSRCVSLNDHTSAKSDEELFLSALTTLANGGAYLFIDAINPDGSLEETFYRRFHDLNRKLEPYRNAVRNLNGRSAAGVGVYFSMESCVNRDINGIKLKNFNGGRANNMSVRKNAVLDEMLGMTEVLNRLHTPWKVVTSSTEDFSGLETLIVCNAAYLAPEETGRLREFVRNGGTLIATGATSLYDVEGCGGKNFALADVFGVDYTGKRSDSVTYTGAELIYAEGNVPLARPVPETEVRGTLTFPDFPVNDPERYASIHSNPPGEKTDFPALTVHRFGKGVCVWLAAPVALQNHATQRTFMKNLLREFLPSFVVQEKNLAESAEITLLKGAEGTELLCIVNRQDEVPVIPLCNVEFSIRHSGRPKRIVRVSDGAEIPVAWENGELHFSIPELHFGEIFRLEGDVE